MVAWIFKLFFMCFFVNLEATEDIDTSLHSQISRRIVKGFAVDINIFPHAVFLYFDVSRPSSCGSSLITTKAVITSAYCLRELKVYKGRIHAYLGASVPLNAKVVRNITSYKVHPRYNPIRGIHDLGVAKFDREVPIMRGIRTISISWKNVNINDTFFTAGWGKQWPNVLPDFSDMRHLVASRQKLLSAPECLKETGLKITPASLCSVPDDGYHYRGDMGNGLVTKKPWMTLVGVVSFMVRGATLYARLLNEKKWVRETVTALYGKEVVDKDCC